MFEMDGPGAASKAGGSRSDKKRRKASQQKQFQLLVAAMITNLLYILAEMYFVFSSQSSTKNELPDDSLLWMKIVSSFPFKTFGFHLVLSALLGYSIVTSVRDGFTYEYYFDVFALNLLSQLLSLFTDYGLYVFLIVPAFVLYKLAGLIRSYVFTKSGAEMMMGSESEGKESKKSGKRKTKESGARRRVVHQ